MTDEQWVRKLNALARRVEAACNGVHPSAWRDLAGHDAARWRALAARGPRAARKKR